MRFTPTGTNWCYFVCTPRRHCRRLKIAEPRQFCERALREACGHLGWTVDSITVRPDGLQVLALVPADFERRKLLRLLRRAAARSLSRSGYGAAAIDGSAFWGGGGWCSVLTNAAAVEAVRCHINLRAHWEGTAS